MTATLLQMARNNIFGHHNRPDEEQTQWPTDSTAGDTAPDFTLPDDQGGEVSLSDLRGRKVIVYFYPAAMTPGCTTQACDFRDNLDSLQPRGLRGRWASRPTSPRSSRSSVSSDRLTIRLLSDARRGRHGGLTARSGRRSSTARPSRASCGATVVVDTEGKVAKARYNVKATGHVAKLRRDLGLA